MNESLEEEEKNRSLSNELFKGGEREKCKLFSDRFLLSFQFQNFFLSRSLPCHSVNIARIRFSHLMYVRLESTIVKKKKNEKKIHFQTKRNDKKNILRHLSNIPYFLPSNGFKKWQIRYRTSKFPA